MFSLLFPMLIKLKNNYLIFVLSIHENSKKNGLETHFMWDLGLFFEFLCTLK
jgi:hypothetical protein